VSEVDTSDMEAMTTEIMSAAREVSRDTYFLFTDHAALALSTCTSGASSGAVIDFLDLDVCEKPIFDVKGVHINGAWLVEMQWARFVDGNPSYYSETARANVASYVLTAPSKARLSPPPNATASGATDNYAIGYHLHELYVYHGTVGSNNVVGNKDSELQGPQEFHDLIVNRTALNISEAYMSGESALIRRNNLEKHYREKAEGYRTFNLSTFKKSVPKGHIGGTRRISSY